jgi:hypothetical protein
LQGVAALKNIFFKSNNLSELKTLSAVSAVKIIASDGKVGYPTFLLSYFSCLQDRHGKTAMFTKDHKSFFVAHFVRAKTIYAEKVT